MSEDMHGWLHKVLWHLPFDWYCRVRVGRFGLPGWGLVQVGQWHVCNRFEDRADRRMGRDWSTATVTDLAGGPETGSSPTDSIDWSTDAARNLNERQIGYSTQEPE